MRNRLIVMGLIIFVGLTFLSVGVMAQEAAAPAAPAATVAPADGGAAPAQVKPKPKKMGLFQVIAHSGVIGIILWLALFACGGAGVYFCVDCVITVNAKKILPQELVNSVTEAMAEGDVLKAISYCEGEPGPLSNVLIAGFSHVEEGFDVIQEAVATAADLETEKLLQKITWLSVCANLAPMLGLLGTVQGMIAAFQDIAAKGAPDITQLALNISQALYTTAGGLTIAIPCVNAFYIFKNSAAKIVLRMEALTMEMIKDLRNVEVVAE